MKNRFVSLFICGVVFLPLLHQLEARADELLPGAARETGSPAMPAPATEEFISLKIPLRSPLFADTPVALVNDEPITLRELAESVSLQQEETAEQAGDKENRYKQVLDRLINIRLVVEEGINIGLNETAEMTTEVENFKLNVQQNMLISKHLQGLEPDPADVADVYKQMSREVQLHSITFASGYQAQQFLNEVKDGDFDQLLAKYVAEGAITEQKTEPHVKIKDLLPQVGQQVYSLAVGGFSTIFRSEGGFLLLRLVDARFVEDPGVRKEAEGIVLDALRKQKAMEYTIALEEKYVTFDNELYENLDFDTDVDALQKDARVLATIRGGEEPVTITVSDLARNLKMGFFHGADKAQKLKMINERKDSTISNMLFRHTCKLEAHALGLDESEDFKIMVAAFERSTIFKAFMSKVIFPDVQLKAEDVRAYYDEHLDTYSSPAMLQLNSLVFDNRQDAESALAKLQKGADYKWVSANASGLIPPGTEGVLPFDRNLLSLTALPEDLQPTLKGAGKGSTLLYAPSENKRFYVLLVDNVFPPEPQPYELAKDEVAKVVFNVKSEELLAEWVAKLKEAYETRNFLVEEVQ